MAAAGDRPRSASSTRSSARWSCWRTPAPDGTDAAPCCSARTRPTRRGCTAPRRSTPYPKDGINDHVVGGAADRQPGAARHQVRRSGTSCTVAPGATVELRLRLRPAARPGPPRRSAQTSTRSMPPGAGRGRRVLRRADPAHAPARTRPMVMRQAFAGMLWSKQLYYYDVAPLAGRRPGPAAAARASRLTGRNAAGATSTPSTSCRCRTSGSTRGSRRGTWPSTAWRWPTSTRRSPSTS